MSSPENTTVLYKKPGLSGWHRKLLDDGATRHRRRQKNHIVVVSHSGDRPFFCASRFAAQSCWPTVKAPSLPFYSAGVFHRSHDRIRAFFFSFLFAMSPQRFALRVETAFRQIP